MCVILATEARSNKHTQVDRNTEDLLHRIGIQTTVRVWIRRVDTFDVSLIPNEIVHEVIYGQQCFHIQENHFISGKLA